ncbi:MAG: S-layer homology domain-containing protein [Eggerthellaceae bacterium]|nr:S-layer homology domain-containing protein [Eggerthellaceae bacterium]
MNAFLAAVPTYLQASGKYQDATFYYAEADSVDCLVNEFGGDFYKDENGYVAYPGLLNGGEGLVANSKSVVRDRFVAEIVRGLTFGLVADNGIEVDRSITVADIAAYDAMTPVEKAAYAAQNQLKAKSIALYLAFENATVRSGKHNISMDSLAALEGMEGPFMALMGSLQEKATGFGISEYLDAIAKVVAVGAAQKLSETVNGRMSSYGVQVELTISPEQIKEIVLGDNAVDVAVCEDIAQAATDQVVQGTIPAYKAGVIAQTYAVLEGVLGGFASNGVTVSDEDYGCAFDEEYSEWEDDLKKEKLLLWFVEDYKDGFKTLKTLLPAGYADALISGANGKLQTSSDAQIAMQYIPTMHESVVADATKTYIEKQLGSGLYDTLYGAIAASLPAQVESGAGSLGYLLGLPQTMSDMMYEDSVLRGILAMNARVKIGTGIGGHPAQSGHDTLYAEILDAYESGYTPEEETDKNLTEAMVEFYKFLSEDTSKTTSEKVALLEELFAVVEENTAPSTELIVAEEIYSYLTENEKINDDQTLAIVLKVYSALLYDANGDVDKKLTDAELAASVNFIIATLGEANPEASDRIAIISNVYSILMEHGYLPKDGEDGNMLATAEAIYDALSEKGYLSDGQSFEIVKKLWAFLMLNDDRSAEAIAAAIDEIYLVVFFGEDPELTPEQRNEIGLIILEVLEEQGYISEDKAIDLFNPYYQEAVAGVLTAEVVDLIVKGIDATAAAVEAAQVAAAAIADSDLKDALLAELAATLETLDAARDIFANGDLNDLRGAMAALLELKGELEKHAVTISALAEEAGIAAEPCIVKALEAADAYIALANKTVADIYAAAVEACEDFAAVYAAWVEDMAARAAAIDPALGDAVRAFLTDVPADSLAILYVYGDEALTKLVADAAVAYGDIYDIVAALAQVLYADGEAIYNAVLASDDFAAVKAEIEGLLADIEEMIEAAKMAPATTIVGYEEKLAELYDRLFDSYEKLYPIVLNAMDQVDPTLSPMVEKLVDALYEALNVSSAFVGAYGEWLPGHAGAMAGALLNAFLENWGEFAPVAGPVAGELAVELATELGRYLLAELVRALPGIDAALYDWFYNNPDKVCGFFAEYGDDMGAFLADNHEIILGILGYIASEFGDEAVEYVLANPEQCLTTLVNWYKTYGDRIWAMIDVYLDYLGVYDAIEVEIAALEAELANLKAELEKAAGEMDAALKAQIEKQIAEIERQIAELEKALKELEAAILAFQADVEEQIEALIAHIEAKIADLKAAVEELEAMARQLNAEIQAAIAEIKAVVEAIETLIGKAAEGVADVEAFFQQLIELFAGAKAFTEAVIADATHGEYAIDPAASYVALGDATIAADGSYADQVAAFMANLAGSKGVQSNYEKVAIADDEDLVATTADILAAIEAGELDEVLANAGLVTVSAGAEDLTVSGVYQLVDVLTAYALSSLNEAESCDWASLVGAEGAAAVEQALAVLEAELVKQLGDEATASLAVEAIEAIAFAYANFSVNYVKLIDAVQAAAPEAHIVAVGLANALEGLTIDVDGFELAIGEYAGWVVKAADLEMLAYAALDEGGNVTFVSAPNAACDAAAVIAEVVEVAMTIDFENDPAAVLELLPLIAEIVDSATWMPNEAGQAYIAEQILGSVDFAAVADAVYTAEPAQPAAVVAVDGVVTETIAASEAVEVTDEAVAVVTFEDGWTVEATFAIEHFATVDSFEDFGEPADGHWYLEEGQGSFANLRTLYMDYALASGLMSGYVNRDSGTITHFGPWDSLDRAQAATVIYRMANEDASATLDPAKYADNATAMADVEDGEYYTAAVNWCVENGIITGYLAGPNKGKFMPYNKVTRSELAAMIQRYCVNVCDVEMRSADVMGYEDSGLIDTTWALPGLEFCKAYGIMTGIYGTNQLNPVGKANRAEAAKMFSVVGHDIL